MTAICLSSTWLPTDPLNQLTVHPSPPPPPSPRRPSCSATSSMMDDVTPLAAPPVVRRTYHHNALRPSPRGATLFNVTLGLSREGRGPRGRYQFIRPFVATLSNKNAPGDRRFIGKLSKTSRDLHDNGGDMAGSGGGGTQHVTAPPTSRFCHPLTIRNVNPPHVVICHGPC